MKEELINNCPLCTDNLNENGLSLHKTMDFHQTDGICWKPERNHPSYEMHQRIIDMMKVFDRKELQLSSAQEKIKNILALPWYKRLFKIYD